MTSARNPVTMKNSRILVFNRPKRISSSIGFPSRPLSMGLGKSLVRSPILVPLPAAKMTAFIRVLKTDGFATAPGEPQAMRVPNAPGQLDCLGEVESHFSGGVRIGAKRDWNPGTKCQAQNRGAGVNFPAVFA